MKSDQPLQQSDDRELHEKIGEAIKVKGVQLASKASALAKPHVVHMPLYAVTPGVELLHKAAASLLAIAFLFALYKAQYPQGSVFTIAESIRASFDQQSASAAQAAQEVWWGLEFTESPSNVSISVVPFSPPEATTTPESGAGQ